MSGLDKTPESSRRGTAPSRPHAPRPTADFALDCRHFRGDKPCHQNRLCTGCDAYEPYTGRVCVIKTGALGDVIRTLSILPELRAQMPGAQVTWVTLAPGARMIAGHPLIDRVLVLDPMSSLRLQQEAFDLVICLDKEPTPCALAMSLFAKRKLGIGLSSFGTPMPLNKEAHAYFALGVSDDLKFRKNLKTYPQLIYGALGWKYRGQRYELPAIAPAARDAARGILERRGWDEARLTLGINVGAGHTFANKMWPARRTAELIEHLQGNHPRVQVMLLGGPEERPAIDEIMRALREAGSAPAGAAPRATIDAGTDHDEPTFAAVVEACDALFTGDTMAMHVAIALGKPVVAWFGPTCAQEIDLFGRGEKLVAKVACGPCYKRHCDQGHACVKHNSIEETAGALARVLRSVQAARRIYALPMVTTTVAAQARRAG